MADGESRDLQPAPATSVVANGGLGGGLEAAPSLPNNVEAEQALLGAILINNEVVDRIAFLGPEHFHDPVHGRIFDIAKTRIQKGQLATPVTLKTLMETDEGLKELGGAKYLASLAKSTISIFHAGDYAQEIYDHALRRRLAELGETITVGALNAANENEPLEQIASAEEQLYSLAETGRAEGGFQTFRSALVDAVEVANAAYQRDGGLAGLSSGMRDMDKKLGGFHNSDLIILAGRPSMGKTALVTNIAFNVAGVYESAASAMTAASAR